MDNSGTGRKCTGPRMRKFLEWELIRKELEGTGGKLNGALRKVINRYDLTANGGKIYVNLEDCKPPKEWPAECHAKAILVSSIQKDPTITSCQLYTNVLSTYCGITRVLCEATLSEFKKGLYPMENTMLEVDQMNRVLEKPPDKEPPSQLMHSGLHHDASSNNEEDDVNQYPHLLQVTPSTSFVIEGAAHHLVHDYQPCIEEPTLSGESVEVKGIESVEEDSKMKIKEYLDSIVFEEGPGTAHAKLTKPCSEESAQVLPNPSTYHSTYAWMLHGAPGNLQSTDNTDATPGCSPSVEMEVDKVGPVSQATWNA